MHLLVLLVLDSVWLLQFIAEILIPLFTSLIKLMATFIIYKSIFFSLAEINVFCILNTWQSACLARLESEADPWHHRSWV